MPRNWARPAGVCRAITLTAASVGLGALLVYSTASAQQSTAVPAAATAPPLAFTGATVIDMNDGRLLPKHTVVVVGNRIQAVGADGDARVPQGARVVDAQGKYLIPGLWDMHTHIEGNANAMYPIFIAHGITGVREMAQRFEGGADSFRVWQREVMAGTRVGPRGIGPSADLSAVWGLETPDDARRVIDSLKAAGMVFLKYHDDQGDPALFLAIAREARRVGLPIVGHLPHAVLTPDVADSGMRTVEHHGACWAGDPYPLPPEDSLDNLDRCRQVAAAYIRNETWVVPTLTLGFYINGDDGMWGRRYMRTLYHLGVRNFLVGTDCFAAPCLPGVSEHQEMFFFVKAGLTPLQALQAATLNPAKFLNATDSLGTVARGKLADLVLLDANPLADIRNVMTVRAVVANGRYFDRAALEALDPDGLKVAEQYHNELMTTGWMRVP